MNKILLLSRDGAIIEKSDDENVDSLEKLDFIPKVISSLKKIKDNCDFELVMITKHIGIGSPSSPDKTVYSPHIKMLSIFGKEGIVFDTELIENSVPKGLKNENMYDVNLMERYENSAEYDLAKSFVVSESISDIELAKKLGANAIWFKGAISKQELPEKLRDVCSLVSNDWEEIATFLTFPPRFAKVERKTNETDISISVNLDGSGKSNISTGLHFFDHMLEQLSRHSNCDMDINVIGDLHVDEHHTIEDTAIALGESFLKALGNKKRIERYGFLLPMDDCLAQVAIDFSGRPWLVWNAEFKREKIGDMPTEMFYHFFKSFSDASKSNLNIMAQGGNEHHKIEAIFKATAKAIKIAVSRNIENKGLPSTKGLL